MSQAQILLGDCRTKLRELAAGSVQCCVTSPPYFGLRDYGHKDQVGLEATPDDYVKQLVRVFREVRRVLRPDGVLWLNLGDSYAGGGCGARDPERWPKQSRNDHMPRHAKKQTGLKFKDLIGIPWMVAFALRNDGWWLRSEVTWVKPNPMPEAVTDRPTCASEKVFLFSKAASYFYDAEAIKEPATGEAPGNTHPWKRPERLTVRSGLNGADRRTGYTTRNARNVWTINPMPYRGAHFAVYPEELAARCIFSGSSEYGQCADCGAPIERQVESVRTLDGEPAPELGAFRNTSKGEPTTAIGVGHHRVRTETRTTGWASSCSCARAGWVKRLPRAGVEPQVVLDPFMGSGTTGAVAIANGRRFVGVELNPDYSKLAEERLRVQTGLPFARGFG